MFELGDALRDGAILALAASALLVGVLRVNSRLFMRHFPDALRKRTAPLSPGEIRAGRAVGVVLLLLLVAGPLVSAALPGPRPAGAVFLHAFVVGMVFNLVDWLVIDELLIGVMRPRWALPPGATQADFLPFDHARHARGFLTGTVLCAVSAALATGVLLAAWALG